MFGDGEGNTAMVVGFGSEEVEKLLMLSGIDLDIGRICVRYHDFWSEHD